MVWYNGSKCRSSELSPNSTAGQKCAFQVFCEWPSILSVVYAYRFSDLWESQGIYLLTLFTTTIWYKPRGASPRRGYEDGISTNRII